MSCERVIINCLPDFNPPPISDYVTSSKTMAHLPPTTSQVIGFQVLQGFYIYIYIYIHIYIYIYIYRGLIGGRHPTI